MTAIASAYAKSGVDITAADRFVAMIRERIAKTWPDDSDQIGGFAGEIQLGRQTNKASASADGSGTMAILGALTERYEVIGINAAAMSLQDMYVAGSKPLGLLDVIDVGKLDPEKHIRIIDGLIDGCKHAGTCRLIGGETAELPDMFKHDWMVNVNTMAIGVPDDHVITGNVRKGQTVWGWRSDGPASNGFSLIRQVFDLKQRPSRARHKLLKHWPNLGETLADALLKPAPIWINQIEIQNRIGARFAAHAHITGGGLVDNIPRVLPPDCKVVLDRSTWHHPPIFDLIARDGKIESEEMDRVFNLGLMVVSILDPVGKEPDTPNILPIGTVEKRADGEPPVQFVGKFIA